MTDALGKTPWSQRPPMVTALAALSLLGVLLASPARSAPVERPDCAGLWLENATLRIRADVAAGLFAHADAELRLALPSDARAALGAGRPRAAVFRCFPGVGSEPALQPVEATVTQSGDDGGDVRVTWKADGALPALALRRYHVYFAPGSGPALGGGEARPGTPALHLGENLLPNAGFEQVDPGDASNPAGWYLSGDLGQGGARIRGVRSEQSARTGRFGFRSWSDGATGAELGGRAVLAEPVPVLPGVRYHLLVHARILDATGRGLQAVAPFLDAESHELPVAIRLEAGAGQRTNGFEAFRTWMVAPPEARFARLSIGTWKSGGTTDVDDVALFADPAGVKPPPIMTTLPPERAAQYRKSFPLDAGAPGLLYDLGPPGSLVAGGFTPLSPADAFDDVSRAGFRGAVTGRTARRPDPLAQDHVELGDATVSFRVPDGNYLVWVLLGDMRSAPPDELTFYRNPVVIKAQGQTRAVIDRRGGLRSTVSLDDDALALRKVGADAVWSRHVAARFADAIFPATVEGGVLDIQCGPAGSCPVAAVGLFQTSDVDALTAAVAAYGERRKASFGLSWAVQEQARAHDAVYLPSAAERARGFVPFIVDPDEDVYPHTTPTRPAADAATRGVTVRVARGETTAFAVGLWASSFRSDVSLRLDQPSTPVGDTLGGTPLQARVAAYQAVRVAPDSDDARYTVRPTFLVQAEKLDLHPGIARLVWVTVSAPADAQGEFDGALLLSAGRERDALVPITVQVLPFSLPPAPQIHGAIGVGGGGVEAILADQAAHGMNAAPFDLPPDVRLDGTRGAVEVGFAPLDLRAGMARQVGMELRAAVTADILAPAFSILGADARRATGFDRLATEILTQTGAHAQSAGWPLLHVLGDPTLLGLCRSAKAPCASPARWAGGRLEATDSEVVLVGVQPDGGLDPAAVRGALGKDKRPVWIHEQGGRLGRGLLPWALGAAGVLRSHHLAHLGDPVNGWDDDDPMPPHVVAQGDAIVPTLLWERARLGVNDARTIALVESLAAQARGPAKALASEADRALADLKATALTRLDPAARRWDGTWAPAKGSLAETRERLLDLAIKLHGAVGR